jgi:excisionase family DNA binding protein
VKEAETPMNDEPEIMNLKEACALLRIHPATGYRLLKQGKLPAFRIGVGAGTEWRFKRSELDKWRLAQSQRAK